MGVFMIFVLILGYFTKMNESYLRIVELSIILGFALLMILKSRNLRNKQ